MTDEELEDWYRVNAIDSDMNILEYEAWQLRNLELDAEFDEAWDQAHKG